MIRFYIIFLAIFIPALSFADTFLLAKPVVRSTRIPYGATAIGAAMLLPNLADNAVYYMATDDAITSSLLFAYCAMNRLPELAAVTRLANEAYELSKDRSLMNQVACNEGANSIQILKTRYGEHMGLTSSQVHSSSFIFVNMEDGMVSGPVGGVDWIRVKKEGDATLRLRLHVPGSGEAASTIDIPLKDLLESGGKIEWEKLKEWKAAVQKWNSTRSFISRRITGSGLNGLTTTNSLVMDGQEIALGEFTHGRGTKNFVGLGTIQRLRSLLNIFDRSTGRTLKVKEHRMNDRGGCESWFGRMMGLTMRKSSASAER